MVAKLGNTEEPPTECSRGLEHGVSNCCQVKYTSRAMTQLTEPQLLSSPHDEELERLLQELGTRTGFVHCDTSEDA